MARIQLEVTEEERRALNEVAIWLGMSRSAYIKMVIFGETAEHRKQIAEARKERNAA